MTADGEVELLTRRGSDGTWWAWCGVQVVGAVDVTQLRQFRQLAHQDLHERAWKLDEAYLGRLVGGSGVVELRWTNDPATGGLELSILGRVSADSEVRVRARAVEHLERLEQLPEHVTSRRMDAAALSAACSPFAGRGVGDLAEVRKAWRDAGGSRSDAPPAWATGPGRAPRYVSSQPLVAVSAAPWASLVRALLACRHKTVVSIGLQPVEPGRRVLAQLENDAAEYRRLSVAGTTQTVGLFAAPAPLAPDPAAETALVSTLDAIQRYSGRVFEFRVSVASSGDLPPGLAQQVQETVSPAESLADRGTAGAALAGTSLRTATALEQGDRQAALANLVSTDFAPWGPQQLTEPARRRVESYRPYGSLVDVREAAALFRFPLAVDGAFPGLEVVRPRDAVRVRTTAAGESSLSLGRQGGEQGDDVRVPVEALSSHTLVVGSTGSGKTNTVLHLLGQLWTERKVPFLVIEPVNSDRDDYRWFLDRPGFEDLLVLTVGDESLAPFRLNPFEVPRGVRVATHLAGLVSCFDAAFGLTGPLPFLYRKALRQSYVGAGISPDEISAERHEGRWPLLSDLAEVFKDLPDLKRYAGEVKANVSAASQLRIESLLTGSCGRTLNTRSSFPMEELLERPVVLELAAVGDDDREQALVTALLLNAMTGSYKASRTTSDLKHVTVVEEAHRLLRKPRPTSGEGGEQAGKAAEQFANTLAENRKYGEGLVIVEQVPSKLVEDALKNTTTKVMHHLPSLDDREAVAGSMNLTEDQVTLAQAMDPFTAYVTHRSLQGWATAVTVPNIRALASPPLPRATGRDGGPQSDEELIRERFVAFAKAHGGVWAELAPYPGCEGCLSRCAFREIGAIAGERTKLQVYSAMKASTFPRDEPSREGVFQEAVRAHRAVAEEYEEQGQRRDDLAACIFTHAMRAAFPSGTAPMVRRFRASAAKES